MNENQGIIAPGVPAGDTPVIWTTQAQWDEVWNVIPANMRFFDNDSVYAKEGHQCLRCPIGILAVDPQKMSADEPDLPRRVIESYRKKHRAVAWMLKATFASHRREQAQGDLSSLNAVCGRLWCGSRRTTVLGANRRTLVRLTSKVMDHELKSWQAGWIDLCVCEGTTVSAMYNGAHLFCYDELPDNILIFLNEQEPDNDAMNAVVLWEE